jgi:hypothetical protein
VDLAHAAATEQPAALVAGADRRRPRSRRWQCPTDGWRRANRGSPSWACRR